jgi:hypothetical protein
MQCDLLGYLNFYPKNSHVDTSLTWQQDIDGAYSLINLNHRLT